MKLKIFGLMSALLFIIASIVASAYSFWIFYQPKEPKSIKKH